MEVLQPPYERVMKLRVAKHDEDGVPGETLLIIEAMGRRSNVVLVRSDGTILDALKRVGPTRNPARRSCRESRTSIRRHRIDSTHWTIRRTKRCSTHNRKG